MAWWTSTTNWADWTRTWECMTRWTSTTRKITTAWIYITWITSFTIRWAVYMTNWTRRVHWSKWSLQRTWWTMRWSSTQNSCLLRWPDKICQFLITNATITVRINPSYNLYYFMLCGIVPTGTKKTCKI